MAASSVRKLLRHRCLAFQRDSGVPAFLFGAALGFSPRRVVGVVRTTLHCGLRFFVIRHAFLSSVLVFACLLASCSGRQSASGGAEDGHGRSAQAKHVDRKPAPDFTLKDASGADVKLSDYRGRAVLLNFWATWCGPCNLEIPWFVDFQKQLQAKGLEVIGVSMDTEGWSVIKPFVASHKMNYRVLLGNDSVSQLYGGVDSLPTSFIIDKEGRIAYVHVGLAGKNDYLNEIEGVLGVPHQGTTTTSAYLGLLAPSSLFGRPAK